MKHKYSRIAFICEYLIIALFLLILLLFMRTFMLDEKAFKKTIYSGAIFYVGMIFTLGRSHFNRAVEFFDDYIRFHSFAFKGMKNAISLNVMCKDILSLTAKTIPVIGVVSVTINANNIPHPITLSICFKKHMQMFKTLCSLVKKHNPKVYIDEKLEKYIGDGEDE